MLVYLFFVNAHALIKCYYFYFSAGENVYISLYGAAQNSSVRLDKNTIKMENTYISMANQRTVTIHNRSDVICHFRWTKYNTQEQEDEEKAL